MLVFFVSLENNDKDESSPSESASAATNICSIICSQEPLLLILSDLCSGMAKLCECIVDTYLGTCVLG